MKRSNNKKPFFKDEDISIIAYFLTLIVVTILAFYLIINRGN